MGPWTYLSLQTNVTSLSVYVSQYYLSIIEYSKKFGMVILIICWLIRPWYGFTFTSFIGVGRWVTPGNTWVLILTLHSGTTPCRAQSFEDHVGCRVSNLVWPCARQNTVPIVSSHQPLVELSACECLCISVINDFCYLPLFCVPSGLLLLSNFSGIKRMGVLCTFWKITHFQWLMHNSLQDLPLFMPVEFYKICFTFCHTFHSQIRTKCTIVNDFSIISIILGVRINLLFRLPSSHIASRFLNCFTVIKSQIFLLLG